MVVYTSLVRVLVILLLVLVAASTVLAYLDDLQLLFSGWLSGKPKAMNKLVIYVPRIEDASRCYIMVKRFPTPCEPSEGGRAVTLFKGAASPGQVIVVKHIFDAIPVASRYVDGKREVLYYEPKEYIVSILCIDRDRHTVFRFSKIYEIRPTKLINTVEIKPSQQRTSMGMSYALSTSADYYSQCRWYSADECIAWIAFTYINSIPGLRTSFTVLGGPIPSAMYIEAFSRSYTELEEPPPFSSAGKKLVPSVVTHQTDYASNGERKRVLLDVVFRYEVDTYCDGLIGLCLIYEYFYPVEVRGVKLDYTEPETPPPYATGPIKGGIDVWFAKQNEMKGPRRLQVSRHCLGYGDPPL